GFESERASAAEAAAQVAGQLASAQEELARARAALEQGAGELVAVRESSAAQEREIHTLRRNAAQQELQLAALERDVADLRARAECQHESLRHAAGFRGVREAQIADREAELATIESRHAAELAARNARGGTQLQESAAREAEL